MNEQKGFRFRWSRRADWGQLEVYDAHLGRFHVGQVHAVQKRGIGEPKPFEWSIPFFTPRESGRVRGADSAREAATALEAAFDDLVAAERLFFMGRSDEVELRALLGIPHTPDLDHDLAIARGEHLLPLRPSDQVGLRLWLDVERKAGRRNWISPEDMRAWYGDLWQDPRKAVRRAP